MTKKEILLESGVTASILGEGENDTVHLSFPGLDGMAVTLNDVLQLFNMCYAVSTPKLKVDEIQTEPKTDNKV